MPKRSRFLAVVIAASVAIAVAACSSSKSATPTSVSRATFATDIEPLVREKCQACHHDGGIAPFPLVTYEQVKELGAIVKEKVSRREMPPWGVFNEPSCTMTRPFKGDLSMTDEQIALISEWVDGGMPRGERSSAEAPNAASTTLGATGLQDKTDTFAVAAAYEVPGATKDDLRCFPIDPKLDADAWVAESIVIPADPKVVHHALVYIDVDHEGMMKADGESGYPCFGGPELKSLDLLLAWSPGGASTTYGEDAAVRIPRNAHLVMQVHYHPLATATTGRLDIELRRMPKPPARIAGFVLLGNAVDASGGVISLLPGPDDPPEGPAFFIPSNAKAHTETMVMTIPPNIRETRLAAVGAHMHWAGVGMKLEVERADPRSTEPAAECLLSAPKYDFNWQRTYAYDRPLTHLPVVRGGDKLRITCTYDNTKDNPHIARLMQEQRLTTPADIRLGSDSRDEMCQAMIVFVD